jgi:hypothetical protein
MNTKILLILVVLLGIVACGCTSQPGQPNPPVSHSTPVDTPTPVATTDTGTVTTTSVPDTPAAASSGKSQYLAEVSGYLENISVPLNAIQKAKMTLDYPTLKEAGDQLEFNIVAGNRFSYRGDDPSLIRIDAMFPLYRENLIVASTHYYQAGSKGMINDTTTAFSEIKAGNAYYIKAMEPGRKIVEEMRNLNVSISQNIQDAHGIWFGGKSKVYT